MRVGDGVGSSSGSFAAALALDRGAAGSTGAAVESSSSVGRESAGSPDQVIEAGGLWLAPGLVDLHAHLREPGQE